MLNGNVNLSPVLTCRKSLKNRGWWAAKRDFNELQDVFTFKLNQFFIANVFYATFKATKDHNKTRNTENSKFFLGSLQQKILTRRKDRLVSKATTVLPGRIILIVKPRTHDQVFFDKFLGIALLARGCTMNSEFSPGKVLSHVHAQTFSLFKSWHDQLLNKASRSVNLCCTHEQIKLVKGKLGRVCGALGINDDVN